MRRRSLVIIAWTFAGLVCSACSSAMAAQDPPGVPVVVTTGEGVVKTAPDRAYVSISAEGRARNPKDAQQQSALIMTAVQKRLQDAQIPKEAVRTTGYDLQQEFDYANGKQTSRGYVARNSIEVRLDDLSRIGDVLDSAVAAGATSVGSIQFDLRDRDKLERDALKLAVADARARADAATAGAGQTVDRVLRIEESRNGGITPPMPQMRMAMTAEAAAAETPIAAGEIEVRARVTLTASLK